jgi:hypothetical protein
MANCFTRRLAFWTGAFEGWVRKTMGIFVAFFTLALIVRDGVLNPQYRDQFLLRYIPELPWHWWLVAGTLCFLLLAMEGAYRFHGSTKSRLFHKHRERVKEVRADHQMREIQANAARLIEADCLAARPEAISYEPPSVAINDPARTAQGPNIWCVGTSVATIDYVDLKFTIQQPSLLLKHGMIAEFRNEVFPDSPTENVKGVVAHLTYFEGAKGKEIHRVSNGAWLGEDYNSTNFLTGRTPRLIIATLTPEGLMEAVEDTRESDERYFQPITVGLPAERLLVLVRLVADGYGELCQQYFWLYPVPTASLELAVKSGEQ